MSTKPSEYPEWADGGSAKIVEPVLGKKQVGWTGGEKPAAEIMNWLQNNQYKWVQWFDFALGRFLGWFGDGTDGAVTFDGVSTPVAGATLVGSTYTLTRDISCTAITVNSGVTIVTAGYIIACQGVLTNNGTIQWNGNPGANGAVSGFAAGGAAQAAGTLLGGAVGGGATNTGDFGGAGGSVTAGYPNVSGTGGVAPTAPTGSCAGGYGGNGSGGTGGNYAGLAASHGAARLPTSTSGRVADGTQFAGGAGGGGGFLGQAGGGGGGAGVLVILAAVIAGVGIISANGGAGGAGYSGGGSGGGGGGGGIVIAVYATGANTNTIEALGGAAGVGVTDLSGSAGTAGVVIKINLSGDGT